MQITIYRAEHFDLLFLIYRKDNDMNTDYIRSLLIMFNNRSVYEIETALAIYEFMDKDAKNVSEEEILKVYDLIHSQDEIYNDYVKEEVIKIEKDYDRQKQLKEDNDKKENDLQREKELEPKEYLEK